MRAAFVTLLASVLASSSALAAEPAGDWRVEDGSAVIRIDTCRGALWGVVAWEKAPGRDDRNPDPTLRGRPTLGTPVLINMRAASSRDRWDGQVYNAQNGQTYTANVRLVGDNTLRIEACVMGGLFCGGQRWTRVGNVPAHGAQTEVCSRVYELSGRPR